MARRPTHYWPTSPTKAPRAYPEPWQRLVERVLLQRGHGTAQVEWRIDQLDKLAGESRQRLVVEIEGQEYRVPPVALEELRDLRPRPLPKVVLT